MSQEEVYKILEELGGKATNKQVRLRAKEKFPDLSLSSSKSFLSIPINNNACKIKRA